MILVKALTFRHFLANRNADSAYSLHFSGFHSIYTSVITIGSKSYTSGARYANSDINVLNCYFFGCGNDIDNGGALHIINSSLKIQNSGFDSCSSRIGGALYVESSNSIISECNYSINRAYDHSGCFFFRSCVLQMSSCLTISCESDSITGALGSYNSSVKIWGSGFVSNLAIKGNSCALFAKCTGIIRNVVFHQNICIFYDPQSVLYIDNSSGPFSISECIFGSNKMNKGAIFNPSIKILGNDIVRLSFCLFDHNYSSIIVEEQSFTSNLVISECKYNVIIPNPYDFQIQQIHKSNSYDLRNSMSTFYLFIVLISSIILLSFVSISLFCF